MLLNQLVKKFADIVNLTENFDNFVIIKHNVVFQITNKLIQQISIFKMCMLKFLPKI